MDRLHSLLTFLRRYAPAVRHLRLAVTCDGPFPNGETGEARHLVLACLGVCASAGALLTLSCRLQLPDILVHGGFAALHSLRELSVEGGQQVTACLRPLAVLQRLELRLCEPWMLSGAAQLPPSLTHLCIGLPRHLAAQANDYVRLPSQVCTGGRVGAVGEMVRRLDEC